MKNTGKPIPVGIPTTPQPQPDKFYDLRDIRPECPACKQKADRQPEYEKGLRTYQHFICDTPDCPVSSFRIEWRTL